MQVELSKIIDPSYLFDAHPPYQFVGFWPLFGFFLLLIITAVFLSTYRFSEWQEPYRKYTLTPLWSAGLVGFILLFARNQSIPYLSTRALLLLAILAFLIWFGYSLTVARRKSVEVRLTVEQREKLSRYLPKKKR